jgi:hypothetical protein|tara:strand:- start:1032 stop:1199 length:168 start_codon:yes stop_codon:yes gene_type:complete
MANYSTYVARLRTENLIKLIEATTRHQAGLKLPLTQARNIEQLQELQAELFRRIA